MSASSSTIRTSTGLMTSRLLGAAHRRAPGPPHRSWADLRRAPPGDRLGGLAGWPEGQLDREGAAETWRAREPHAAAVRLDDEAHDVQPETEAGRLQVRDGALEGQE